VSLEQEVAASAWVFDVRSGLPFHFGDHREARRRQLCGHFAGIKEVSVEVDGMSEPVGDVIHLTGRELGTVDMERNQQPATRLYHSGEFTVGRWPFARREVGDRLRRNRTCPRCVGHSELQHRASSERQPW
jgi:hypothetical protein